MVSVCNAAGSVLSGRCKRYLFPSSPGPYGKPRYNFAKLQLRKLVILLGESLLSGVWVLFPNAPLELLHPGIDVITPQKHKWKERLPMVSSVYILLVPPPCATRTNWLVGRFDWLSFLQSVNSHELCEDLMQVGTTKLWKKASAHTLLIGRQSYTTQAQMFSITNLAGWELLSRIKVTWKQALWYWNSGSDKMKWDMRWCMRSSDTDWFML